MRPALDANTATWKHITRLKATRLGTGECLVLRCLLESLASKLYLWVLCMNPGACINVRQAPGEDTTIGTPMP